MKATKVLSFQVRRDQAGTVRGVSVRGAYFAIWVALVGVMVLAATAFAGTPDLSGPKSFHRFPVYWAGDEVAGMPLEDISEGNGFTFFYGDCELSGTDHP
jgi:hypothetical protein